MNPEGDPRTEYARPAKKTANTKPTAPTPAHDRIPAALRAQDRWVLWRYEWKTDKWTKVPYRADGRGKASTSNPETWATFNTAWKAYQTRRQRADGIGFVIGAGIVGVDIDHCRNPETGELTPEAAEAIHTLNTYTEVSPSGAGIRAFAFGELPSSGRKRGAFEMYDGDGGRYLTVTGQHLTHTPTEPQPRQTELAVIHAQHIEPPTAHVPVPAAVSARDITASANTGMHLTDRDVLARMRRAKPAAASLYDGDMSAYDGDHSRADLALCSHLAWWCDYDAEQVDRLFRQSALMRDKWDEQRGAETYGAMTIREAIGPKRPGDRYTGVPPTNITPLGRDPTDPGVGDEDAPGDVAIEQPEEPDGWRRRGDTLERTTGVDRDGVPKWSTVYVGHLVVIATGRTIEGEERLTVAFDLGHERRTVTAPRGDLVRARGVLDHLGAAGANVHDGNARDVSRYLSEYSARNADALPRQRLSERLGITPGGIIGPGGWQVGEQITYAGPELYALTIRSDRNAYRDGLRALGTWETSAWLARAVLGLVAASPHLEYLGMPRNPVLGIGGPSNIGKGTAVGFAFALWAEPAHPLMVSGIRTRTTALLQVYAQTNGLPVWIDEAHQLPPAVVTDGVYAFANRQTYARGGREGVAKGGDRLRGTLILTGEGLTELMTTGARNRVLIVDGLRHYPLGREMAADRAAILERATASGAGSVGQTVAAHLWEHRDTWKRDVHQLAEQLTTDAPTWHVAAAAAEVTIRYILDALNLPADRGAEGLALHMLAAVTEGWREVDPARDAFERVRDLVIAARSSDGTRRGRDGSALARVVTTDGKPTWAVRATAPEVDDVLKPYGGARVVAPLWQRRGYIRPDPQGRSTRAAKLEPGQPTVRCYIFAQEHFEVADDADRTAAEARVDLERRGN